MDGWSDWSGSSTESIREKLFPEKFFVRHPATVIISGPTLAGKTELVIRLLKNRNKLIKPRPERIIWGYGERNEKQMDRIREAAREVEFVEGFPDWSKIDPDANNLLILDDLMSEIGKNQEIQNLFTRGSHHKNTTVIAIIHNLFDQNRHSRTISLNSRYFILFKSPRDNYQIDRFGQQIFPKHKHFLSEALSQATERPFGYLIIDLHPVTKELTRVRTGIFPNEIPIIFLPPNQL